MDLTPGQTIGQYRIVQKIGEGGMGAVYKADQPSIPRAVVIKVLGSGFAEYTDALDRFRRELDMITRLEHPHILPVYDYGEINGNPYIVMRYMTGGSLQDRLQSGGWTRSEGLRLLDQVALALDFAHDRGIIHRDLKPGNVLVDDAGNAYLADFGLAKSISGTQDLTATGSTLGSPAYMSPEQARGEKLTRQSDIYAFAVLVYRVLSGRLPFESDTAWGFITAHLSEEPAPIRRFAPDLPPAVESVLADGLAKDPLARPDRATDLMASLHAGLSGGAAIPASPSTSRSSQAAVSGSAVSGSRAVPAPRRRAPAWRLPAIVAAGAVALLVFGGIAAVVLYFGATSLRGDTVTTYPVGDEPRALLFDGDSLWVANFFGNSLTKLSVSGCGTSGEGCGENLGTFDVDDLPVALAFDGESLWVASSLEQTVSAVNPGSGEVGARHLLPHVPSALAWDGQSLWSANAIDGSVTQIARDGRILADIDVGLAPAAIAFDGTSLWVIDQEGRSLVRIDPDGAQVQESIALDSEPISMALDGSDLWIGLGDTGEVIQLDPENPTAPRRIDLGSSPAALFFDGDQLWAAAPGAGEVYRIDPVTAQIVDTIAIDGYPVALLTVSCGPDCRALWTANQTGDSVSRVSIE